MTSQTGPNLGATQRSLAERARDHIRERITSGQYPPGSRIKERELSEELGISRIPIREALTGLSTEGFITLQPRRGAVVTELAPEDLHEIFEIREVLEVQEVVLALRHGTESEKQTLLEIVEAERDAVRAGDADRVASGNAAFHQQLVEMSHNALLASLLDLLRSRLSWLLRQNDDASTICAQHFEIASAIAEGEQARACELADEHVATSRRLATSLLFGEDGS